MIKNWQGAVAGLSMSEPELEQTRRTAKHAWRVLAIMLTLVYLIFFCLAAWDLMRAWQNARPDDWKEFWQNTRTLFGFTAALLIWIQDPITPLIRVGARVIAAREAAVAGDDLHAPVSAQQPASPQHIDLITPTRFGPLRAPGQSQRTAVFVGTIFLLFIGVIMGFLGVVLLTFIPTTATDTVVRIAGWLVVGVAAFTLAGSALLLWRFYLLRRPLIVEADDWGLHWRQLEKRHVSKSIAWHEARAFVLLRKRRTTEEYARESAFALVGRDATLVWLVNPTAVYGTHEELAGLIAVRTKLPLRDITEDVEKDGDEDDAVLSDSAAPTTLVSSTRPSALPDSVQRSDGGTPSAGVERWLILRGCLIILLTALISLAPVGLLAGVGWGLQGYQITFYTSLVQQVHAQQPVFADRLAYDDGRWPVVSNDQFHQSWFYQNGAYHVRAENPVQTVAAPGPESYGDATVEATVAQQYRGTSGGVGLLLRSSEGNKDFVVFQVNPKGQWALLRYHDISDSERSWQPIWHGESEAIHQGIGVQNRLLVIINGARYLCYVNNQFLGVFQDDGPALYQGRMGVFVNESTTEGVFSDFTVYPALSTDIFA